jgi:DNA-binding MarR family transcriptional regulator
MPSLATGSPVPRSPASKKKLPPEHNSAVIAARVNSLSNHLVTSATQTYGKLGLGFLRARLIYLLGRRPGVNGATASAVIGVDPAATSRAFKSLIEDSLVTAGKGPQRALSLTKQGKALLTSVNALSAERERRLLHDFSAEEAELLLQFLTRMLANAQAVAQIAGEADAVIAAAGVPAADTL